MRIAFAHAEQPARPWPGGTLRIGSGADNDLVLEGRGVADHHVILVEDARGLVLEVCPGAGHVYVNARPVREKALLRLGDSLGIGDCRLCLVADALDEGAPGEEGATAVRDGVMALRAVAGPLSGRVFALEQRLEMDMRGPVAMSGHGEALVLERRGARVRLDAAGLAAGHAPVVNGIRTREAVLGDGDQVVLGVHRFVIDVSVRAEPVAVPGPSPEAGVEAGGRGRHGMRPEMWLVVTAALLALVLAGALLIHY